MSEFFGRELPLGWVDAKIADVVSPRIGKADPQATPDARFIGMEHVEAQTMRLLGTVPASTMKSAANTFRAGDVLYGRLRAYLNKVYQPDFAGLCSSEFIVLGESSAVHGGFLKYLLNSGDFVRFASQLNTGDRPRVDWDQVKSYAFGLPPRREQGRIADALDELLSDLDAGVATLERVRAKLRHYRAAVLKAAVEGELTEEWRRQHPETETADALLTRVLEERRQRWEDAQLAKFEAARKAPPKNWRREYVEPVVPESLTISKLPDGWSVASMDALSSRITSGSRDWKQYYGSGLGTFIMAQNVRPARLDMSFRQPVNPPLSDTSCERSLVRRDDLLVTIVGANTGDVCRVPEALQQHYVCQSVALMRPVEPATARFLDVYFNALAGGQLYFQRCLYGAGRPHLSFDQLKATPVVLPSLDEQQAIVETVEDQLSIIEHLECDLESRLKGAKALRQSILRHAFTGQLMPQDPNDEPAGELLKCIAIEREPRARPTRAAKRAKPKTRAPRSRAKKN